MVPSLPRRAMVALALAAAVTLPSWANGSAEPGAGRAQVAPAAAGVPLVSTAWGWLRALWSEAGCGFDPSGSNCGVQSSPGTDAGCGLDPNGRPICGPTGPGTSISHGR
jgi:hypothetical protein